MLEIEYLRSSVCDPIMAHNSQRRWQKRPAFRG
jgi:hypothetical protein